MFVSCEPNCAQTGIAGAQADATENQTKAAEAARPEAEAARRRLEMEPVTVSLRRLHVGLSGLGGRDAVIKALPMLTSWLSEASAAEFELRLGRAGPAEASAIGALRDAASRILANVASARAKIVAALRPILIERFGADYTVGEPARLAHLAAGALLSGSSLNLPDAYVSPSYIDDGDAGS